MIHDDKAATSHNEPSNRRKVAATFGTPNDLNDWHQGRMNSATGMIFTFGCVRPCSKYPIFYMGAKCFLKDPTEIACTHEARLKKIVFVLPFSSAFCVFGSFQQTWSRMVNKSLFFALWAVLLKLQPDLALRASELWQLSHALTSLLNCTL